jgi:hypothetical protein
MVKLNTPHDENVELANKLIELISLILVGTGFGIVCGLAGLGLGLIMLNVVPAIGLGLFSAAFGVAWGLTSLAEHLVKESKNAN